MDRRFHSIPFDQEDPGSSPENGPDSPYSGDDPKLPAVPSPKKSKRSAKKKVVSVLIGDVDGSRSKSDGYPPSDSWAWRKYGQKPIKGSPYPRGYYRCSSSKGCPARKQVERSRLDPTMMIITYSFEHNHPSPPIKHHHYHQQHTAATAAATSAVATPVPAVTSPALAPEELSVFTTQPDLDPDHAFAELAASGEFDWLSDVASTSPSPIIECPAASRSCHVDVDDGRLYTMGEEEESFFADLGELPEYSVVFRRSVLEQSESTQRCSLAAHWCGTTG